MMHRSAGFDVKMAENLQKYHLLPKFLWVVYYMKMIDS